MDALLLLGLIALNAGISAWNAYASGAYLTESKLVGGWSRILVWCGLVMSACGFTWVYLTLAVMVAIATGHLTPEWATVALKLGYLVIILPVIGSGMAIWIESLVTAYRQRTFGSVLRAGWNTYAQASNVWSAARDAPGFLDDVLDAFSSKKGKNDGAAAVLVVLLVVLALCAGAITTGIIARWADKRVAVDVAGWFGGRRGEPLGLRG